MTQSPSLARSRRPRRRRRARPGRDRDRRRAGRHRRCSSRSASATAPAARAARPLRRRSPSRVAGLPGWAALPSALATASLLTALFGMYWDISLHIDHGRDPGPLANPAHYLILVGLFGIFAAGFLAMCLPMEKPGPTAVRITDDWYAPLGGVLIAAVRRLRADRLPARRRLAPAVRPGRDAVGPDAPDADRRRRDDADRPGRPARRGHARAAPEPAAAASPPWRAAAPRRRSPAAS